MEINSHKLKYLNLKIAILGSDEDDNKTKIKDIIFKFANKYDTKLIIISSGGKYGVPRYVKKYSLEFGLNYREYNIASTPRNEYSMMYRNYYGKRFHPTQIPHQQYNIVINSDVVVVIDHLSYKEEKNKLIKLCKKYDKNIIIYKEES